MVVLASVGDFAEISVDQLIRVGLTGLEKSDLLLTYYLLVYWDGQF